QPRTEGINAGIRLAQRRASGYANLHNLIEDVPPPPTACSANVELGGQAVSWYRTQCRPSGGIAGVKGA
ncbi:MAG: hypothetical protein J2P17_26850, partial [Mycobacterium sp.]|nr:hypothetical protein [Mycobacterium sp.]